MNLNIHLKIDSMSTLTNINKLGGAFSPHLNSLAKEQSMIGQAVEPGRGVEHH